MSPQQPAEAFRPPAGTATGPNPSAPAKALAPAEIAAARRVVLHARIAIAVVAIVLSASRLAEAVHAHPGASPLGTPSLRDVLLFVASLFLALSFSGFAAAAWRLAKSAGWRTASRSALATRIVAATALAVLLGWRNV